MERVGAGGGGGIWLKWRELGRGHLVKMERVGAGGGGGGIWLKWRELGRGGGGGSG